MPKKVAIIDIGTNTINLLMVNKYVDSYAIIHSERVGVGLGHGGLSKSIITKSAFKKGLACLNQFSKICYKHNISTIQAFGTSTLRHAKNATKFINSVKLDTNIDIKVLDGEEEAQLIYKGIKLGFDFIEKSVIMDIGGGSTELILADSNGVIEKNSFEIGTSRINQQFNFKDKLSKQDRLNIELYLNDKTGDRLDNFKANQLVGSSGSFKTFYEVVYQKKFPTKLYQTITTKDLKKALEYIIHSTKEERENDKFITPLRERLISISAVKTKWIIDKIGCKRIIISPNSIKEGVIFD